MSDLEATDVLVSVLQMLREQAVYLHRQHGWLIAVAETIQNNPDLDAHLKQHPFYDQGPRQDAQITDVMIRNIDLLIQRLKDED